MQVDRQPSPWPSVVMLVGLVLVCVTVPRFWRTPLDRFAGSGASQSEFTSPSIDSRGTVNCQSPTGTGFGPLQYRGFGQSSIGASRVQLLHSDLSSLWAGPTIEELVAERIVANQPYPGPVSWPVIDFALVPKAEQAFDMEQHPAIANAFDRIGRAMVVYAPAELVPRLTLQAAKAYQLWTTRHESGLRDSQTAATLRVLQPEDTLAGIPDYTERVPLSTPAPEEFEPAPETDPWSVPQILFDQLQRIAEHEYARNWARNTLNQLYELQGQRAIPGSDVQQLLGELCLSTQDAAVLAEGAEDACLRVELLRAHWGLARRLDRWSAVHDIHIAALSQQRFAARGSLGTYFDGQSSREIESTDQLTMQLEAYEEARDPAVGRLIVATKRSLEENADPLDRALANAVEQHYRNANVRVAISAEMLNRYVGQPRSELRPLRERVGGASVRGQSHLQSTSRVHLDPAVGRWELGLESNGTIESNSLADGGQAKFRTRSATDFSARKRIVVDAEGVMMQPASIDVDYRNQLMGVTTDVDWVPLVRSYARDRALQEYRARQPNAKRQIESKVAAEAANSIDQETQEAVERFERQIRERVTERLSAYGVQVTPIELTTTHQRVIARLRVASDDQPASHTPRPRALSDSLISAQIHETALTNAAISLELDGRRYTTDELAELIREKFPNNTAQLADDHERDAVFQFADRDAVKFRFDDGRLEITLSLVQLELNGRRMRNFAVHAFYTPTINGLEADLVRDGALGIEGRLSSSDRARLHNVFNAILPADRALPIVRLSDKNDPRLAGLMITQLVLEDGWLGISAGPADRERVAERSRSLR